MPDTPHRRLATDLRGASRLAVDATLGLTDLVENLHHNIARGSLPVGAASMQPTSGITGLVYRSIRGVTRLVGGSLDALLGQVQVLLERADPKPGDDDRGEGERAAVRAALNGVLGDHLQASANPLALRMRLLHDGRALALPAAAATADAPAAAPMPAALDLPQAGPRVLLVLHGLCMHPGQWRRQGHDHPATLAQAGGFTLLHLHYNTGLHVADNGAQLAALLQSLQAAWPVPLQQIAVVAHSMGGLVMRSALCQAAQHGHGWARQVTHIAFLGTPHHGAPLERGGHWVDRILQSSPYTAAFARLGKLRSAGITDLRHGSLLDADRTGPDRFAPGRDTRVHVPLPAGVDCLAVAGSLAPAAGALREKLLGDGLVPLASALGRHRQRARCLSFAPDRQWVGQGIDHIGLMHRPEVLARLQDWLLPSAPGRVTSDVRAGAP